MIFLVDKGTKEKVWQMLDSFHYMQRDVEKDNGLHWSWFWEKVVLYQWRHSTRRMGSNGGKNFGGISREWLSNFPCFKSIVSRSIQKAKVMENCRYTMQPNWKRAIKFLTRAKRDQDKCLWIVMIWLTKSSIATIWGAPWRVVTTRQIKQISYRCRVSEFLRLDNTSRRKTLQIFHNFTQWHVRIMSVKKDDYHSWLRISHRSYQFVLNLNNKVTGRSRITTSRRKELCSWYCICVVKPTDKTNQWQRNHKDPSNLPHSAHELQHVKWCTRDPMCA